jgi:hypothetical protein
LMDEEGIEEGREEWMVEEVVEWSKRKRFI